MGKELTPSSISSWSAAAVAIGMLASVMILPALLSPGESAVTQQAVDELELGGASGSGTGSDRFADPPGGDVSRPQSPASHQTQPSKIDPAIDRSELQHAEQPLRESIEREPEDARFRMQLIDLAGERTPPRDSDAYRSARSLLPARFIEHETRRFVVLSDADSRWTRLQAERLERAHHQFMRFARQLNLDPLPLRHKLVCILFQDQNDYLEFAAMHDEMNARWVSGYYSPRFDRIVFYNVASGANIHAARQQIAAMDAEVDHLRRQAASARRAGDTTSASQIDERLRGYEYHLREQRERLDSFTTNTIIATTIHEAIHQLAYHTLIQHPAVDYPMWLSEGLATAFETDRPDQAFGPGDDFQDRRQAFASLLRDDRLMPLRKLIAMTSRDGTENERMAVAYAQSYALVTWVFRFRRDELRAYLRLMLSAPRRTLSSEEHIQFFESAFGDVDRLERAWLRHEQARSASDF
jgi:hypothetical protein